MGSSETNTFSGKDTLDRIKMMRKACGLKIFSDTMETFKEYRMLGFPAEIANIWFGVSFSMLEMMLNNIKEVNLDKFEHHKENLLNKLRSLEKQIKDIKSQTEGLYS